jgi:hypothetical protein
MATFATMFTRFLPGRDESAANARTQRRNEMFRLRHWPNEDLLFPVKPIDNSRVVPKADRKDRSASWRVMFGFAGMVMLLIAILLPSAYSLTAGYKLQELKRKNAQLRAESTLLDVEIAKKTSPANLEQYAVKGNMRTPSNKKLVYLEPSDSVAMSIEGK